MKNVIRRYTICVCVFVIVNIGYTVQNPLKDPRICGRPTCNDNEKFKYGPGSQQDYKYRVEARSLFNGTSKNESTLYVEGMVKLAFLTPCDGILTLSDIKLSEYIPRDDYESSDHANSEQFSKEITENSLRFAFNDGIISELCPSDDEKSWVLNFKRGILSMLHNSMRRFDLDHWVDEDDIRGKCPTNYTVIGAKETSLVIEKRKDLNSCQTRGKLHSAVQSVPYSSQPGKLEYNILKSNSECSLIIDHNIYSSIVCRENHILRPLSNNHSGATTTIVQNLTLISEQAEDVDYELPDITRRTTLHYDHLLTDKARSNAKLKESRDLIKKLCQQDPDDIQFQMSDLFSKFIRTSRVLSFPALKSLYGHTNRICKAARKIFLDGLPYIGTSSSVRLMKEIISNGEVPESTVNEWVISIAFTSRPDDDTMEVSARLLEEQTFSPNIALSVASLSHTYCRLYPDCRNNQAVSTIVQYLESKIRHFYHDYHDSKRDVKENLIVALKSLSNIGIMSEDFEDEIFQIIENQNINPEVRLAAIETFRRLPCEDYRTYFQTLYSDRDENVEVRISSYLQFMKCPNYLTIRTLRNSLLNEDVNQVGSFVWTHLNNLLKSAIPSRVEIQSILSENDLSKKFDTDARKFSHNREGSIFFENWRAGASYDNDIIFSPDSYIPRSAKLNLTVDVFGESINFFEMNARAEGFEQFVESLFGPKGTSRNFTDNIPILSRFIRDTNSDKALMSKLNTVPNPRKDHTENPQVSLGFKIFGNELNYTTLNGLGEIKDALGKLNPVNYIKDILSGKEISFNKAVMFLDSSYVVASGAGLPIELNAIGTASVDIKLHGSIRGNFMKNPELDVTVNVKPSVSLDISGEMSVNAFYAATGIKLKTNVYTASAVETYVKIRGSQLVSIKCTLPRQNTEIIGARSELLIKQNDMEQSQSGLSRNRVSQSICYWPVVDKALGLKPCGDYHFTNVTRMSNAPYFLLAGPAGFRWYLNKSDPTAKIYLFEYKKTQANNGTVYSMVMDTPGSSLKRLVSANLILAKRNITMLIKSSDGALMARAKYKNTEDETLLELTLDINNQKHFDASFSINREPSPNGFKYLPRVYLGVNNERVVDLQGHVTLTSKNGIAQYYVNLKFQTKRLRSKLIGYITRKESSLAIQMHLDYKFQNSKEHRLVLYYYLANNSKNNMVVLRGSCNLNSTAYPDFNFDTNVTFFRTDARMDLNVTLNQNPLTIGHPDADRQTLTFLFTLSHKFLDNRNMISSQVAVARPSNNLNINGLLNYEHIRDDINCKLSVTSNGKEVGFNVFWSHPRTTLEKIKLHTNVTIPSFRPMILILEIEEKQAKNYMFDIKGTWFSGDTVTVNGIYQDRSTIEEDHHLKLTIKSPQINELDVHLNYFKNTTLWLFDLKGNKSEYILYLERNTARESITNAIVKYKKKLYTLNSSVENRNDYRKAEVSLKIDQLRDIHFLLSVYNRQTYKAFEFDLKWDANRDPTQKLLFTSNFSQIAKFNQNANFYISYPGRTVVGKYEFLLERNKIDTLASISWDDDRTLGLDFLATVETKNRLALDLNMQINTPFESWRVMKITGRFDHLKDMYALRGGVTWDHRQRILLDFYGDRLITTKDANYDYKFNLNSTLHNIPSIAAKVIHYQNSSSFNSNLHFMYNPENKIDVDSKWKIIKEGTHTNLTGNVFLKTPFKGLNRGVLISKIFLNGQKYIRGVAELDLDNKRIFGNLEGQFKKLTNSMLIINVTSDEEVYQGRFILSEERRHVAAQLIYPNGSLGTEILFSMQTFSDFDIKFILDTPISFLTHVVAVARLKPGDADFRLGWNFLLVGFSGVWHYANVTDFEYAYKIYTPIEDFEENGVVGKLIFKEGLDFEVSIKLSKYKLGLKLVGKPKPKLLEDMNIKKQEIYGLPDNETINWEGLIEIDVITYPTMTGKLEIDQNGHDYTLQVKLILPAGAARLIDVFTFYDIMRLHNKLQIETPYETFRTISSDLELHIVPNYIYLLDANFNYQNKSKLIETAVFAKYKSDNKEQQDSKYNATLSVVTPFEALPKLRVSANYETELNFYRGRISATTNKNAFDLNVSYEIKGQVNEFNGDITVQTPSISVPPYYVTVVTHFTDKGNTLMSKINCPDQNLDIYVKSWWEIISKNVFGWSVEIESSLSGLEKMDANLHVDIGRKKSHVLAGLTLNPFVVDISSHIIENTLNFNSTLEINKKRIPIVANCQLTPRDEDTSIINGDLQLKDKTFKINGIVHFQSQIPVNVSIQFDPLDKTDSTRDSDKLTEFNLFATGNNTFNWEFQLKMKIPKKREITMYSKAYGTENNKRLEVNVTTPIPNLENPRFGLSLITNGLKKTVNGFFELEKSKGDMHINVIWVFLENMMIKAVGHFENKQIRTDSYIEAFYNNPRKEYKYLEIGTDVNIDQLWEGGSNITLTLPTGKSMALEAHVKLPNNKKDIHSISGNLSYGRKLKTIYYQARYSTSETQKRYGSSGQVNVANDEDMKGDIEIEWNGKTFKNFANLKRPKDVVDLIYKLKTPKYPDQHLFVALINFKKLTDRYNISGEAYYPEKTSVAYGTVNYKELGNMNGMFNITVPYKRINFTGAYFNTLTNDNAYNRYVKVFWNNESATLDGICNIMRGREASESITEGKLNVTLPLATTHRVDVDFKYDKKEKLRVGVANINYNKEKVLLAKYKCLVEKRENFNKKTIHVELENDMVPVGADYVHGTEYSAGREAGVARKATRDRFNAPTVVDDSKYLHLYHLKNASKFNVTGALDVSTSPTGQKYIGSATHLNRTVKLWMDYDVLSKQYKQHSRLELSPTIWIEYDLDLRNGTVDETFDAQQIQINVSYPRRNFTAQSFYNISDSIVSTDVSLVWDKDNKRVQAGLDWMRLSPYRDQIELLLKHPSFQRDVSFFSEYGYNDTSIDVALTVNYSENPDQTVTMKGTLSDHSNSFTSNYTYLLEAEHNATSLSLRSFGDLYWNNDGYGTEHITHYKRSYLPLSTAETFARVNLTENTIELKNQNIVAGLSYLWGRYGGNFPVYTANISATHGINDTSGEFHLNLRKKLLYLDLNMTKDGTQSLHVHGLIPDARSAAFDIWRDYEDIRVSDISYYLRLNHSRLITSSLLWRRDVVSDVQSVIRNGVGSFYNDSLKAINETQQYVIAESMEAMHDIWNDAKPLVDEFLNDLRHLSVIEEDIEVFRRFLNVSYEANAFYMKDIAGIINTLFDESSLKAHLSSLPKIVQEIWQVMGSSAEKINKAIRWAMEMLNTYYKNTHEFIHKLMYGDPIKHLTDLLKEIVEKYDEYIKSVHVAVLQYMEKLWIQTYSLIVDNWHKTLAALEPTFIKFLHYLETIVWNTSKEFLDFLYIRKNEIIVNPYFAKFSNFTHDLDKFYKDITGNNTISSVYKYSKIAWNFLKEKYLNNVPFAKEVESIINEIISEISELQNIPTIKYFMNKCNESYEFIKFYYEYFIVETNFQYVLTTVYAKLTDKTPTALETDNRLRAAKTKFIFDPNEGIMLLEQKLPMSWHAFNETPRYQEIPEIKAIYGLKDYFATSQISFWNLYNKFQQLSNPADWLPPFKGQAMLIGSKYYVTFDRKYYDFQGGCTYLLATDFRDRNFTLLASYDVTGQSNELVLIVNNTVVHIDVFKNIVKVGNSEYLPVEIGNTYVYRDADMVTVDSPLGFLLKCNMKFHICNLELSGWYFGKTGGLMGTLNNEPSDDFLQSTKIKANQTNIESFANSWSIKQNCPTKKPTRKRKTQVKPAIKKLCDEFYTSDMSDLADCFSKVPKAPFMQMCLNGATEEEACTSAVAYIELCLYQDTPLRIPDVCVKCKLLNGTEIEEGKSIRLSQSQLPETADVVFIVEAKPCNTNVRRTKNMDIVLDSINKELIGRNFTDNKFGVVVFGGRGVYREPRGVVVNGNIFSSAKDAGRHFDRIPISGGNVDVFEAVMFAQQLVFRPGAAKIFILMPCSKCDENKMEYDYSTVQSQLFESSIALHILMHAEFSQHRDRDNKVYGLDSEAVYTKKDLEGNRNLKKYVDPPKSILGVCVPLANEMKGAIFSTKPLVSGEKQARKLSGVFAKRVAQSATPKSCLDCECTASNSGVSYMECNSCRGYI